MKKIQILLIASTLALASIANAQLHWSSYDTSGSLVNANAGTGGEGASTVNLAVGAGQTLIFIANNFQPLNMSVNGTLTTVNFTLAASGGLTGVTTRDLGVGLFSSAGTAGNLNDDTGLFGLWNPGGPYPELYAHTTGANLFSGTQQGQGGNYTGTMVDSTTYNDLIRLFKNSSGVALGNGSALANAGIGFEGTSPTVDQRAYINPVAGMPTSYDEFGIMFYNSTGDEITLTVGNAGLTVPEPSTFALAGLGLAGWLIRRRSRK